MKSKTATKTKTTTSSKMKTTTRKTTNKKKPTVVLLTKAEARLIFGKKVDPYDDQRIVLRGQRHYSYKVSSLQMVRKKLTMEGRPTRMGYSVKSEKYGTRRAFVYSGHFEDFLKAYLPKPSASEIREQRKNFLNKVETAEREWTDYKDREWNDHINTQGTQGYTHKQKILELNEKWNNLWKKRLEFSRTEAQIREQARVDNEMSEIKEQIKKEEKKLALHKKNFLKYIKMSKKRPRSSSGEDDAPTAKKIPKI